MGVQANIYIYIFNYRIYCRQFLQVSLRLRTKCQFCSGIIEGTQIQPYLVQTEWVYDFWPDAIHNSTASHCSQNLSYYVEEGSEDAGLAAGQEAQGDGRIQVCTADVTYTLDQSSNGRAKSKCHLYLLVWVSVIFVPYGCREANEDEDHHTKELGQDGPPESPRFDLGHGCVDQTDMCQCSTVEWGHFSRGPFPPAEQMKT